MYMYACIVTDISFSCFLSHPGAFWGAFLAPILAVMMFNLVIFIWVIVVLIRHTRGTASRKKEAVSNKTILRLMISIGGVMFLFGLTWFFAILTFSVPGLRETFQSLFTVSNSFQGFFIFLFFCVFSKEAREYWKEALSCGKYTSQFLHPSQTRYISSSGTGAKKNKKSTATTGISSTSAGRSDYVSETTSKTTNHYESSTIVKQGTSGHTEKIPLDYEHLKQRTEVLEPTTQTFKNADSGESTSKDGASIHEATTMVVETSFNKATLATADSQQPSSIKDTIEMISKDGESIGEAAIVVIQTTATPTKDIQQPNEEKRGDNDEKQGE